MGHNVIDSTKKKFTDGTKDDIHTKHPITRQPIHYISDPSHMIKKIVSSLSSRNRNIFKVVDNKDRRVSLTVMFELWMSFNYNLG